MIFAAFLVCESDIETRFPNGLAFALHLRFVLPFSITSTGTGTGNKGTDTGICQGFLIVAAFAQDLQGGMFLMILLLFLYELRVRFEKFCQICSSIV